MFNSIKTYLLFNFIVIFILDNYFLCLSYWVGVYAKMLYLNYQYLSYVAGCYACECNYVKIFYLNLFRINLIIDQPNRNQN